MLRAVLLASPLALVLVVSCSSNDSADFKDTGPVSGSSTGATSSTSGASAGGTSSQGGSNASAGSNATAGSNASGGKGNTGGNGNTAGNQNMAGKGNGNGGTVNGNAGAPTDMAGAGPGNAGAPGAAGANTGGTNGGGPLCPDIFGNYKINGFDGFCTELNKNAVQSIQGNDVTCQAHFVSLGANPNNPVGVNGGAAIDENGDFTDAMLFLNKTLRNPCSGTWNADNGRMIIQCGGQGDLCTVELERN